MIKILSFTWDIILTKEDDDGGEDDEVEANDPKTEEFILGDD